MRKNATLLMKKFKPKEHELKNYIDNLITLNAKIATDGSILLINETAASLIQKNPEELVGSKIWATPFWNYDQEVMETLQVAVTKAAAGQTIYYEAKNQLGPGKFIYIDFTLNPVLDHKHEVIYLVAEGRDITERKIMEQELVAANEELVATNEELVSIEEELRYTNEEIHRAHQKLYNILESITDAFYAVNHHWEVTYVNNEAEQLLNKKKFDIIGKNLWQEFPGMVDTLIYQQLHKVMSQQSVSHFEYFFEPATRWFNIHAYPSVDGISIYFHDITYYKKTQERMTLQNHYLTALHETALALMNRLELDELLEAIVARAAKILGTPHGWLYLINTDNSELVLRMGIGHFRQMVGLRLVPGEGLAGKVWQSGEPMFVEDYSTWLGRSANYVFLKMHSCVAIPLKTGQETLGILGFGFFDKQKNIVPEQLSLLTGFAQLASIALDNARLYNAAQQELTERKRVEEILRYLAYHDTLTDLPNRTLFNDRLSVALSQAKRNNGNFAVMFLDLDYFKMVNDTLGHDVGDRLLKGIASKLSNLLRKGDTISRIGGDEFTILLHGINQLEDAALVAQKIIDTLREPWVVGVHEFHITTSIGIAFYPNDGEDQETLIKNADAAMYQAKQNGRNNFQFYTPAMNARAIYRLELENHLRKALERDEFIIYYQPQVEISTGLIMGIEALIRWQHPEWGLISPAEFIPIAEDTGLILSIGEWVIQTACYQAKAWQDLGFPPIRISVNLSARQFQQPNLVLKVADILSKTGLDPRWLELEITESIAMKDVEFTGKMLFELRKMGITIAIDDFGTGYSSLSYLKRLPIDIIKIDRSFIRDITTDPDDASIVSTIIVLARNLKMQVIAEGVETEEQLTFLRKQKCDQMQGYLFSKPLPAQNLENIFLQ